MGTIPMGNFGQGAGMAPLVRTQAPGGRDATGAALRELGQDVSDVASNQMAVQDRAAREAQQQADALARVEANNVSSEYELQVASEQDRMSEDLRAGRIDWRDAGSEWETRLGKIKAPSLPGGSDPVLGAQFQGAINQTNTRAKLKVDGLIQGARQNHYEAEAAKGFKLNIQRAAMPDGDTAVAVQRNSAMLPLLREAGFDEAKAGDMVRRANQAVYVNEVNGRIGVATGNVESLKGVLDDLIGEQGRYMATIEDPDTRLSLANTVRVKIDQAQTSERVAIDKREAAAERTVDNVWKQAQSGVPPTPEMVTQWRADVAGTTQEGALAAAIQSVADVQLALRAPELEQDAYTQDLRRKLAAGGTPEDLSRIEKITKTIEESQKLRREAPLSWLEGMTGTPTQPIDFAAIAEDGAGGLAAILADRQSAVSTVRKAYGPTVRESLLLPGEAKMLGGMVSKMQPEQLLTTFAMLRDGMGSADTYTSVMKQIAPEAPMKAYAGEIAVRPGGQKAATLLLRGDALLDTKEGAPKFPMPSSSKFEEFFAETVGSAYRERPEDFNRDLQAFRAVYAGALAADGKAEAGKEFDENLAQNALAATLGGPPSEYNGKAVIAPWGMPSDVFADKADALVEHALKAAGLQNKGGITLVNTTRPGVFYLAVGRIPVMDPTRKTATGQPGTVFIDFNAPPPAPEQPHTLSQEARDISDAALLRGGMR